MFILYIGGQKSGKSKLAEQHTLKIKNKKKPYYIATYNDSFKDKQMKQKIKHHLKQRKNKFITINETKRLHIVLTKNNTYIIDCISMWIFNNINKSEKYLLKQLKKVLNTNNNIVFVLNDVNSGIIPLDKITRRFINLTGIVGQYLAKNSDEVYDIKFGIKTKIK